MADSCHWHHHLNIQLNDPATKSWFVKLKLVSVSQAPWSRSGSSVHYSSAVSDLDIVTYLVNIQQMSSPTEFQVGSAQREIMDRSGSNCEFFVFLIIHA